MKFRKLARRLGVRQYEAAGILEMLWIATQKNAPRGDIGRWDNEEIAIAIDWPGNADELVDALVDCGWLDRCDTYRLVVHDWHTHAPRYIHGVVAKCGGFVTTVADYSEPLQSVTVVVDCTEGQRNVTKRNLTNNVRTLGVPSWEGFEVTEQVYADCRDRLMQIHAVVDKTRNLLEADRKLAIHAAVMARERLGEDWLDDLLASHKIRRGSAQNRWAYFARACQRSAEERGVDWHAETKRIRIDDKLLKPRQPVPAGAQEAQCTS